METNEQNRIQAQDIVVRDKEHLRTILAVLPEETTRQYEDACMKLAMDKKALDFSAWTKHVLELPDDAPCADVKQLLRSAGAEREYHFDEWVEQLMELPPSKDPKEEKIAFAAFCIRLGQLRRKLDYSKEEVLEKYRARFGGHVYYGHLEQMCLLDRDPLGKAERILELGNQNRAAMQGNAGIHHAFAIAVAEIWELTETCPEKRPGYVPGEDDSLNPWLKEGVFAARLALSMRHYPKYFSTLGRLLALTGDYDGALENLNKAINTEDSKKEDYAIRIGVYRGQIQQIREKERSRKNIRTIQNELDEAMKSNKQILEAKVEEVTQDIKNKQQELEEENRSSLVKNIEFLGLFSGIVSFTIGSISISGQLAQISIPGAAGLLVVLMGALLVVFAGFGVILHGFGGVSEPKKSPNGADQGRPVKAAGWLRDDKRSRNVIVLLLGLMLAAAGVLICYL